MSASCCSNWRSSSALQLALKPRCQTSVAVAVVVWIHLLAAIVEAGGKSDSAVQGQSKFSSKGADGQSYGMLPPSISGLPATPRHGAPSEGLRDATRENAKEDAPESNQNQLWENCDMRVYCKDGNNQLTEAQMPMPMRGPRGAPGAQGPKGAKGEAGAPGPPGADYGSFQAAAAKVAFSAGLSNNMGPLEVDTDVIFDYILTNIGNAYNFNNGHFVAPIDGAYQFMITIAAMGKKRAAVALVRNDVQVLTLWTESIPYWTSATNSAILHLKSSDRITVRLLAKASFLHGYMYSTFSGHLLFPLSYEASQ